MRITSRGVQIALGVLWLLDGALQLQHQMFTSSFANQVIAPTAQGQPLVVGGLVHFAVHVILLHPTIFDVCFVLIQLGIGAAILWKRTVGYGLIASVVWGLLVWLVGEGLAGLASGHVTLLMGAPGAALLYAIIALAVRPSKKSGKQKPDSQPAYWLALVWATLWIGGAVFQLLPGQDSVSSLSSMIAGNASGAPGWLATIDTHVASAVNGLGVPMASMAARHMSAMQMAHMSTQSGSGYWFILVIAALQLCIGLGIFYKGRLRNLAIGAGIALSIAFWILGQSLGAYYTGLATDPNAAPLFVLLGVAILGCTQLDRGLLSLSGRIENMLLGGPE